MKYPVFFVILLFSSASHAALLLEDWAFNIDGTLSEDYRGDDFPLDGTLDDGLGTLSLEITGEGGHRVLGFFDFEIAEDTNTFFNEFGLATGNVGIGQSWEIDEPGFKFGDIYDHVVIIDAVLDNTTGVTQGNEEDVAFAMGWDFSLLSDDVATIEYVITDVLPTSDFFLTQTDPDLNESIYFYSSLSIATTGTPSGPDVPPTEVPEPYTLPLVLLGLLGLWLRAGTRARVD